MEQGGAEQVERGTVDGLCIFHVVGLKGDAIGNSLIGAFKGSAGKILDYEVKTWEGGGDREGDMSVDPPIWSDEHKSVRFEGETRDELHARLWLDDWLDQLAGNN